VVGGGDRHGVDVGAGEDLLVVAGDRGDRRDELLGPVEVPLVETAAELLIWALAVRAPPTAVAAAARREDFSRNCLRLMESWPDMKPPADGRGRARPPHGANAISSRPGELRNAL
jgi:hypothetical protein